MTATREIAIRNRHPRLRVRTHALRAVLTTLDSEFRTTPADLPHLTVEARQRARQKAAPLPHGELSIVFLDDPSLARLHGDFLDDPTTTDVITFEGMPAASTVGEVCVSVDTARRYARDSRLPFADELLLYVIHGWLHLAGYDDLQPARKRRMRAAEARAMKLVSAHGPCFTWVPACT